jgi:hypothetical protein
MMRISAIFGRCNRSNVAVAGSPGKLASHRGVIVVSSWG